MMANLLNWFGGTKGELREALAAGAVAEVELPPEQRRGRSTRSCVAPDGREQPLLVPAGASKVTVGPLDRMRRLERRRARRLRASRSDCTRTESRRPARARQRRRGR